MVGRRKWSSGCVPIMKLTSPTPPSEGCVCTTESILCVQVSQNPVCAAESILCAQGAYRNNINYIPMRDQNSPPPMNNMLIGVITGKCLGVYTRNPTRRHTRENNSIVHADADNYDGDDGDDDDEEEEDDDDCDDQGFFLFWMKTMWACILEFVELHRLVRLWLPRSGLLQETGSGGSGKGCKCVSFVCVPIMKLSNGYGW